MVKILLTFLFVISLQARPQRPAAGEGEVRDYGNQKVFKYDNTELKRSGELEKNEPVYKYDVELHDNYRSLDEDKNIEKLECTENTVTIHTMNKTELYKVGDVFTGGEMWKCNFDLMRKIKEVSYDGKEKNLHVYHFKTEKAELKHIFKRATVDYHMPTAAEMKEEEALKGAIYSVDFISPTEDSVIDSEVGMEVAFSITGCTQSDCGDVTVKASLYHDRTWPVPNVLRKTEVMKCTAATNYNCRFHIDMRNCGFGYDESNFVEFKFSKNGKEFLKKEMDFVTDNVRFIYEYPAKGTIINMGDQVNITWDATSAAMRKYSSIKFVIYKVVDFWFDSKVVTYTTQMSNGKFSFVPSESAGFKKGHEYYASIDLGDVYESERFTINDGSNSIQIIQPDITTFISNGDILTVGWEYKSQPTGTITVKLMKGIWYWFDEECYKKTDISPSTTQVDLPIGSLDESTNYYIQIDFTAQGIDHQVYSDYFTYGRTKKFSILSAVVSENRKTVTINLKALAYTGKFTMAIHQKFPILGVFDSLIPGTDEREISTYNVGEVYSETFAYTQGSFFRAYVEFKYKCLYKDKLCSKERYFIDNIPYQHDLFNWNYNTLSETVDKKEIELFGYTCANGQLDKQVGNSFKDICAKVPGFDFQLAASCRDCYAYAPIKAFGFELTINAGFAYKARLNVQADLLLSAALLAKIKGEYHFNYLADLTGNLTYPIKLNVGPVVINIKPSMKFGFGFDLGANLMLEAEAAIAKHYRLLMTFDSTLDDDKQFQIGLKEVNDGKLTASVAGSVDVTLEPYLTGDFALQVKVYRQSVISANVGLKLGVTVKTDFQYPPFPVDNVYSKDYPYYIKVDAGFYVKVHYFVDILDKKKYQNDDITLLPPRLNFKFGLIKSKSGSQGMNMAIPMGSSVGTLDALSVASLENEVSKLMSVLGSTKYGIKDINEFLMSTEKDSTKSTSSVYYYNFRNYDEHVTEQLLKETKKCLTSNSCSVNLNSYPTISKVKPSILTCQLQGCSSCNLDETKCEAA